MRIVAVAVAVLTASSCVTLYGGAVHRVRVTSAPPGARVFVDGKHAGVTPVRVTVSSRDPEVVITVEKDGCPTVSRRLRRSRSVGRILASIGTGAGFGFLTSLAINRRLDDYNPLSSAVGFFWPMIDSLSGALFKFPDRVDVRLAPPDPGGVWSSERRDRSASGRVAASAVFGLAGGIRERGRPERERRLPEPRGLRGSLGLNLNRPPAARRSAVSFEPLPQPAVGPVQPGGHVPLRNVQLPGDLGGRAVLDVAEPHDLLERGRQLVDGLHQQGPQRVGVGGGVGRQIRSRPLAVGQRREP